MYLAQATAVATVTGAAIAACAALITGGLAYVLQIQTARRQERRDSVNRNAEHILKQINQLYGPLILLRRQSKHYWEKLRQESVKDWRLLNYLEEVRSNPARLALANLLVDINTQCENIILENSGLIEGIVIPESFYIFMSHCGIVRVALETGEVPGGDFIYYPPHFDSDLLQAHDELKRRHNALIRTLGGG